MLCIGNAVNLWNFLLWQFLNYLFFFPIFSTSNNDKDKEDIYCHVLYIVVDVLIFSFLIAVLFNANESLYVLETEYIYFHNNMAYFI